MRQSQKPLTHSETVTAVIAAGDLLYLGIWYFVLYMQAAAIQSAGEDTGRASAVSLYFFFIFALISGVFGYLAGRFANNFVLPAVLHLLLSAVFFFVLQSTEDGSAGIFVLIFPTLYTLIFMIAALIAFRRTRQKQKEENRKSME